MRKDINDRKEEIIDRLKHGEPALTISKLLNCKYDTLKLRMIEWKVNHLINPGRRGLPHPEAYIPAKFYFRKNCKIGTHKLRLKLFKEGIKEKRCEFCNLTEWLNKPIPLELDHINGDKYDNQLENLRILCPNCHTLTPTYKSKNRKLRRCTPMVSEKT